MNGPGNDEEKGGLSRDLTKKILTLGLGAYFLTEDTVRRYVKDAKLPSNIGKTITQNAVKGKDELYGFVARELSEFLKQMDFQAELDRFVRSHKIRINAEIEFFPAKPPGAELDPSAEGEPLEEEEAAEGGVVEWNVNIKTADPPEPRPAPEPDPESEETAAVPPGE